MEVLNDKKIRLKITNIYIYIYVSIRALMGICAKYLAFDTYPTPNTKNSSLADITYIAYILAHITFCVLTVANLQ